MQDRSYLSLRKRGQQKSQRGPNDTGPRKEEERGARTTIIYAFMRGGRSAMRYPHVFVTGSAPCSLDSHYQVPMLSSGQREAHIVAR